MPPSSTTPLIVRSVDYAGEAHPAAAKRSVVAAVAHLPLRDKDAAHTFRLLAGPRWTPNAPLNSGFSGSAQTANHGFIHISCEDFSKPAQNLKWASDALDRLVKVANVRDLRCLSVAIA
jgi:small subunit ribosomal protein S35